MNHKIKINTENINNSGFGNNSNAEGRRLVNKDGTANLKKTGLLFFQHLSIYHTLLKMSTRKFLFVIFSFYMAMNLFFASLYLSIGVENLSGTEIQHTFFDKFLHAFFFSSQTLTTVGYGHISPSGITANLIASMESFVGIMTFAVVTGILFARFSRPHAYIKFSEQFLVAPYKDGKAIMFRLASYKNNELTDVEATVTTALHLMENDIRVTKFFTLKLEISKINSMAISWTCVHFLNEESPLYGLTQKDFEESDMELMVTIKGFDDHYSNIVQQRTSYKISEMIYDAKFSPMFGQSESGNYTEVKIDKLGEYEMLKK